MNDQSLSLDAVLWDFGGVFTPSPFHDIGTYANELGITSGELADLVLGYQLPDGDHPWHRVERGEIPLKDALAAVTIDIHAAGYEGFSAKSFFASMSMDADEARREAMYDVVRRLRAAGVANSLVTNNVVEFGERWQRLVPTGVFDDIVDSSAVGIRKPDAAIYRLALERLGGPDPARTAFLDDHESNVNGAAALGIQAILVGPDPLAAAAELIETAGLD